MFFNYSKLRGRIREKYGTEQKFAEGMGMGRVALSQKFGNRGGFTQEQILRAAEQLEFDVQEIPDYFFNVAQKREQTARKGGATVNRNEKNPADIGREHPESEGVMRFAVGNAVVEVDAAKVMLSVRSESHHFEALIEANFGKKDFPVELGYVDEAADRSESLEQL